MAPGTPKRHGQRQQVCGIVVNERLNLARPDYDRLRAAVHQIGRLADPDEFADTLARLRGQLGWLAQLNPRRARTLSRQLERSLGKTAGRPPDGGPA